MDYGTKVVWIVVFLVVMRILVFGIGLAVIIRLLKDFLNKKG
jgi:hypothetical protein